MSRKKPKIGDYLEKKDDMTKVMKAFESQYSKGNFIPTLTQISRDTGVPVKVIYQIKETLSFNKDNCPYRLCLPSCIADKLAIVKNLSGEEKSADKIAAFNALTKVYGVADNDMTQSNTFNLKISLSEESKINDSVVIRTDEVQAQDGRLTTNDN